LEFSNVEVMSNVRVLVPCTRTAWTDSLSISQLPHRTSSPPSHLRGTVLKTALFHLFAPASPLYAWHGGGIALRPESGGYFLTNPYYIPVPSYPLPFAHLRIADLLRMRMPPSHAQFRSAPPFMAISNSMFKKGMGIPHNCLRGREPTCRAPETIRL